MKRTLTMLTAIPLLLLTGACAEDAADDVALEEPVADTLAVGDVAQPQSGAVLRVDTLEGVGPYLTDADGRAVYLLEGEPEGQSTCQDACAEVWPPYLATGGTPTAGAAPVQAGLIGTLQRADGGTQVTYGGHALYYYQADQGPGQATGQDVTDEWGEWYLVQPSGGPLEQHAGGSGGT